MPTVYHDVNFGQLFSVLNRPIRWVRSVVAKAVSLCQYPRMKSYLFLSALWLSMFANTAAAQMETTIPAAAIPDDPIAAAASGLTAQIEDDVNPGGDMQLVSMKSDGCKTVITGVLPPASNDPAANVTANTRTWTIDWAVPGSVAPGDTFIFIDVAPVKIAIVGDASKPDQAAKLSALFAAMFETQLDCTTQF